MRAKVWLPAGHTRPPWSTVSRSHECLKRRAVSAK